MVHVGSALHLGPGALPNTDNPVLVGVKDLAHFAHGLGVCGGGGKVAVQVQPAKQASPAIVPLCSIGQTPGHQCLTLQSQSKFVRIIKWLVACC